MMDKNEFDDILETLNEIKDFFQVLLFNLMKPNHFYQNPKNLKDFTTGSKLFESYQSTLINQLLHGVLNNKN